MRFLLAPMILVAASLASAADKTPAPGQAAASTPPTADKTWQVLRCLGDANGNNKLTREELAAVNPAPVRQALRNFEKIDSNGDGTITFEEYSRHIQKGRSDWEDTFKAADTDKSGGLSQAELAKTKAGEFGQIKQRFEQMDADRNGEVTMAERDAFLEKAKEQRQARRTAPAGKTGPGTAPAERKPAAPGR